MHLKTASESYYNKSLAGKNVQPAFYVNLVFLLYVKVKEFVREYFVLCLLAPAFNVSLELQGSKRMHVYICILYIRVHVLHFMDLMSFIFVHCSLQSSVSPWSSKGDTVQTSSPSSVDTVIMEMTHCGYTMTRQRRVVKSLPLPSLVQCTLSNL